MHEAACRTRPPLNSPLAGALDDWLELFGPDSWREFFKELEREEAQPPRRSP
jgi:hypothetical protein